MERYKKNATWLMYLAPLKTLSISGAYLTPFFLQNGLNLAQVFLLQSIFSVVCVLWELPSGYIADKFGRAFSIKISAPIAASSMILYAFSHTFWQCAACEVVLAIANGLMSGIDTALLLDSLKASGEERLFVRLSQRINAFGYAGTTVGVPIAILLVHFVSVSATLFADGVLIALGMIFTFRLVEAPRYNASQEAIRASAWHAMKKLSRNVEARWLITFGAVLNAATYLAFWLAAPYYASMGIAAIWFSSILAVRSFWKAWLSHRFVQERHVERNMFVYAILSGFTYFAMATGQLWLLWAVLGHDTVQALQSQPILERLNVHIEHEFRATINSLVNLLQRLLYSVAGPLLGILVDKVGLRTGFLVMGIVCTITSLFAFSKIRALKTFQKVG